MVGNFFLFLGALWGSWMVWVGGILRMIPFLEDMIEPWLRKKYPKVDAWFVASGEALKKNLKLIALICLFIGCYRAWVFEHRNAQTAMYGKDGKSEAWAKYNECDKQRAVNDSVAKSCTSNLTYQQSRNDGQQDLFNRCMLALGINSKPKAPTFTTRILPVTFVSSKDNSTLSVYVATVRVSQNQTELNGELHCKNPFTLLETNVARSQWPMAIERHNSMLSEDTALISEPLGRWLESDTLVIFFSAKQMYADSCTFRLP